MELFNSSALHVELSNFNAQYVELSNSSGLNVKLPNSNAHIVNLRLVPTWLYGTAVLCLNNAP